MHKLKQKKASEIYMQKNLGASSWSFIHKASGIVHTKAGATIVYLQVCIVDEKNYSRLYLLYASSTVRRYGLPPPIVGASMLGGSKTL